MAEKFDQAESRVFDRVYICRRCNARNKTNDPDSTSCRKCGYTSLRAKNSEFAG
jgi:ribosomal protein L40E